MIKRPKLLDNPNVDGIKALCEDYLDEVELGVEDTDTQHYLFEAAMEAFYGKDVWKFINSR